jgi:hypothetical protein
MTLAPGSHTTLRPVALLVLGLALAAGCSVGSPVLCVAGLPDGGCSYHVEVHCSDTALCRPGSTPVLDAGACVRDTSSDVIGCS